jgi:hypothetical protein
MSTETSPTAAEIDTYFDTLERSLQAMPELQPGFEFAAHNPELVLTTYLGYVSLVSHMAELSDSDRAVMHTAKESMVEHGGSFGTASKVSADELLTELGGHEELLQTLAAESANPDSPYFAPALAELVKRMEGGHQLKLRGGQPSDDDPESRKVIWGHTMISNPEALVHFMICHYMERYFAVGLADHGSELALEKDFMLNALIDVVILDHLNNNRFANIYDIWRRSKDERGLGWINNDRLASYESQAAK